MTSHRPRLSETTAPLAAFTKTTLSTTNHHDHEHHRQHRTVSFTKLIHEARELWDLAWPTIVIMWGFAGCPFLTASFVGRTYGSLYLDGLALAFLSGNITTLALIEGLLSASDTLSPQAYGAGNHVEVGLLAIRGFVASMVIIVPINVVLALYMEPLLCLLHIDPEASHYATQWYRIYITALPFYALYGALWKFLSSQSVLMPMVVVGVLGTFVILPICLVIFDAWWGFLGSSVAVLVYEAASSLSLLLYVCIVQPHQPTTWPPQLLQRHWRDALQWKPMWRFIRLGFGGALMLSEWMYWEAVTLVIGTLGVIPLSAHTVATQMITMSFTLPYAVGIALAICMGHTLPSHTGGVRQTKALVVTCLFLGLVVFGVVSIAMYCGRHTIYSLFINVNEDAQVWAGCEQIWVMVCAYYFNVSWYGINIGIATGLGMQLTVGIVTMIVLWLWALPASWYAAKAVAAQHGNGDDPNYNGTEALVAAWFWINPPYISLNIALSVCFCSMDWWAIRDKIRIREGMIGDGIPDDDDSNDEEAIQKGVLLPGLAGSYGSVDGTNQVP